MAGRSTRSKAPRGGGSGSGGPRRGRVGGPASGIPAGGPGQGPPSGLPASGRAAQPWPEGNVIALTAGGHRSPRVYGALARELAAGLLVDRPDLAAYPEAVAGWATAEAQAALLRRHLDEVGPVDPATAEPRSSSLAALSRFERQAAEHRSTLGLDPRSEAALLRERAAAATLVVDLDALAERGRQALAAQAGGSADLAGDVLARVRAAAPVVPGVAGG